MNQEWKDRIDERGGERRDLPCVRGAGVPVEEVIEALATGTSVERVLERFPILDERDVRACFAYAVEALRRDRFVRKVEIAQAESRAGLGIPDEDLDSFFSEDGE